MKLDTKKTVMTGLAFLSICAFWQMYDNIIPMMLTNTFELSETVSGAIMAADNLFALFLLPFFGALSDKSNTRIGKRMPFILGGTAAAVCLMNILPRLDNSYFAAPSAGKLVAFVAVLGLLLVAMGTYRSPAVALMPDLTPKPLRSKANAIINLMGALGGVIYLLVASTLYSSSRTSGLEHVDYAPIFSIVALIMTAAVIVLFIMVKEPVGQTLHHSMAEQPQPAKKAQPLSGEIKRSLIFLLASICLWFIGYNAITTWFTTYAAGVWGMALGDSSRCLTVATVGAIASYLPIGQLASRIGRKRTIMGGVVLLSGCFALGFVFSQVFSGFSPLLYIIFALVGLAWAAINVNSLPMVVEMCGDGDIGRFTGYYYTFSMAAQSITPICAGWLMNNIGYEALFPYAAIFTAIAFVTMIFVRHGDSRPVAKKGLEALDVEN